jgi:carboxypeptidase T
MRNLLLCLLASLSFLPTQAQQLRHDRVKVLTHAIAGGLEGLGAMGIAVDHGEVKQGHWFTTDLSSDEIALLDAKGYPYEVLIRDVAAYYVAQNRDGAQKDGGSARDACDPPPPFPIPANFGLGSMGGFYTWEEMLDILDAMHATFPDLISAKESIGLTTEGRPIHMVRMSNAPDVDQDKPEVFYNALHHAREPASLSQIIFYMWHLLENYGSDAEVTYLLDNMEFYIVPCVNPDGYVYNATTNPEGGGMWRKNRRDNGNGTFGVDLNRNYGQGWGFNNSGSSPNPNSEVYRGPSAFSEPETQVMRDFCNSREFRLTLNYHTFGNLLIYPWGYQPSFFTPDSAVFVNYGALLTRDNGYTYGTADQTVNYTTNGGSDDWMYGEQTTKPKIFAMTPESGEAGDGFWPPASRITDICLVNISQNLNMAHLAGKFALATDRSPSILGNSSGHIAFDLLRLGQEAGDFSVSLELLNGAGTTGNAIAFAGMQLMEQRSDSIAYTLDGSIADGTVLRFVLAVNNGAFAYRDTLSKIYGAAQVLLADDASTLDNWQSAGWDLSTTTWFTPPSSITDSPNGNYPNGANFIITLAEAVDLGQATTARLNFMAKWDIEPGYDYVQVLASGDDGISWVPLCGQWTKVGSQFQDPGQPLFDGAQSTWVQEEMSLNAFLGGPLLIRFLLISDDGVTRDGFHFDDLRITVTGAGSTAIQHMGTALPVLGLSPNPSADHTLIRYTLPAQSKLATIIIRNALGELVRSIPITAAQGSVVLNTGDLAAGIYTCSLVVPEGGIATSRLIVARH